MIVTCVRSGCHLDGDRGCRHLLPTFWWVLGFRTVLGTGAECREEELHIGEMVVTGPSPWATVTVANGCSPSATATTVWSG